MILLLGASASGKTEIAKRLGVDFGIVKAVTHTTRPMRQGEQNDVDYHFVSPETFLAMKEKDLFVETTFYNGNYYGCSKAEIGDEKVIILDPAGIASFLALGDPRIIVFYLDADEKTREKRMSLRGDQPENIASRLSNDRITFAEATLPHIDFRISVNDESVASLAAKVMELYRARLSSL